MAITVNMHEAKSQLSKLVARALVGEEVIIARAGRPVARIVPAQPVRGRREPGSAIGLLTTTEDFHLPLRAELIAEFER